MNSSPSEWIAVKTRTKDTKSLQCNVLSILSFRTVCKPEGKKWNASELNSL